MWCLTLLIEKINLNGKINDLVGREIRKKNENKIVHKLRIGYKRPCHFSGYKASTASSHSEVLFFNLPQLINKCMLRKCPERKRKSKLY